MIGAYKLWCQISYIQSEAIYSKKVLRGINNEQIQTIRSTAWITTLTVTFVAYERVFYISDSFC